MSTKTKTVEKTTTENDTDDAPHVVAYRVGKLEERFDRFEDQLDMLGNGFASRRELTDQVSLSQQEHSEIRGLIRTTKMDLQAEIKLVNIKADHTQGWLNKGAWLVVSTVILGVISLLFVNQLTSGRVHF